MSRQSSRTPSLETVMDLVVDSHLLETHTAMPGIVESFEDQKASVVPQVRDKKNGAFIDLPVVPSVPVAFPRFFGFVITGPIKKGTSGLLIVCEKSIDEWLKNGTVSSPRHPRRHNLSDAVFIPGLYSFSNLIPNFNEDDMEIRKEDDTVLVRLKDDGDLELKGKNITFDADTKVTVNASNVLIDSDDIKLGGDTVTQPFVRGTDLLTFLTTFSGNYNSHTHIHSPGPSPPAPTAPPLPTQPAPTPTTFNSTNIKGK